MEREVTLYSMLGIKGDTQNFDLKPDSSTSLEGSITPGTSSDLYFQTYLTLSPNFFVSVAVISPRVSVVNVIFTLKGEHQQGC